MQPSVVSAFEHDRVPIRMERGPTAISPAEAELLATIANSRPGFCTLGFRSIQLAQYAGVIGIGKRVLEILPKVEDGAVASEEGRGVFLRLLRMASALKLFSNGTISQELFRRPLLEIFIAAFLEEVAVLVRAGLLRRYQSQEDDLPLVRGRLMIGRQAGVHAMRVDRLACRFDELTPDNVWNQVLKAALQIVRPWISNLSLARRWLELSAALADVSDVHVEQSAIAELVFDRQAARYKPAMVWAKWILAMLSPNLRAGRSEAPSLLFDMNQLFEAAIVTLLKRRASAVGVLTVEAQDTGLSLTSLNGSDGKRAYNLRPDIVVRSGDKVIAVGDTKWTRVGVRPDGHLQPSGAHIYQMHAYASVYDCDSLSLIYPWHSGLIGSRPTTFELPMIGNRRPVINVILVDVGTDSFVSATGAIPCAISTLLRCSAALGQ